MTRRPFNTTLDDAIIERLNRYAKLKHTTRNIIIEKAVDQMVPPLDSIRLSESELEKIRRMIMSL